ncbi:hypothetical protein BJX65DRAFT_295627 [Aspergillus insuetus]
MATQTAENVALSQLQSEQAELLNTIDRLAELGVRGTTELPQVVVWGRQWREKTYPHSRFKAVIDPSLSRAVEARNRLQAFSLRLFTSEKDLWCVYEEVSKYLQSTGTVAIDDILRIEICGPDKPNVTVVDIPALHLSTTSDGDNKQDLSVARQTVERYMGNPNSILLAKFDPNLERTIGIIVHPDVLETSSDDEDKCLQLLEYGRIKLPLKWHAISTAVQEDPAGNPSGQMSGKPHVGKWAQLPQEIVGFESLRRCVTEGRLKEQQAKLTKMGVHLTSVDQQRGELLRIAEFFGEPGTLSDPNFSRLRAIMTMLHNDFAEAMVIGGASREILYDDAQLIPSVELEKEINNGARLSQEGEIVGSRDHSAVRSLFQAQVQPWPNLARKT